MFSEEYLFMAKDNVEVEIKVKITKNKYEEIRRFLTKQAKFVKESSHVDTYYSPKIKSFLKPKYPYEWLSIRQRSGKQLLNYKHWYPEGSKNTTHCDEYETKFENKDQLDKILKTLGIEKIVIVDKQRFDYLYENEINVSLDKVKGLGHFLEAESLNNIGGIKKAYSNLEEFIKKLGIKRIETIPGGYAAEMMRKKGLMEKY